MGPLAGLKVIEFAGIGPGPFCGMMLADMGADVIRVDRLGAQPLLALKYDVLARGRRSIALDLKLPDAVDVVLRMIEQSDALFEGFRPGVMERLGLGPEVCLERNPRLVYGRVTGWGQDGPLAQTAGHDIDYIALTGALHAIGTPDTPVPPLNLIGDFGGGGMLLAFGIVCALLEARTSGRGQVVDAAMVDGAASLMAMIYGMRANGLWSGERGTNLLDGGAPFYRTYRCKDAKWIAIGALEPKFYAELMRLIGLEGEFDQWRWEGQAEALTELFATRTRQEWCGLLEGTDACFAPVLGLEEAPNHAHNVARGTFVERDGVSQPAPSPRFSRTTPTLSSPPPEPGSNSMQILTDFGFSNLEISSMREEGVIA